MIGIRRRASIMGTALLITAGLAVLGTGIVTHALTPAAAAATAGTIEGTDVGPATDVSSSGAVTTNWTDVKAAGMTFVGVEADDGANNPTPGKVYSAQVTGALNAGLYVMPYIMGDPYYVKTGADQFGNGWAVIKSVTAQPYATGSQYLPIALDMEAQPQVPSNACYGLSKSGMQAWIASFIAAAEKQVPGMTPVIYSNPNWWQACVGSTTEFSADPLWIASYGVSSPAIPSGWPGYTFWQQSDSATINGIGSGADLDVMQGAPQAITIMSGAGGSVQVQTLNSLAGQGVSYSAGSLPAGVSLTTAGNTGKLSWTSALGVGMHTVTVTPASTAAPATPVLPASVPVTFKVHGVITLSTPNRSSTAGAPVWIRVRTSGPDQGAGFKPSLKASGLPSGLSMSSSGIITGWLTRPGTYHVRVTASDLLGGTGSASFTWTVRAASDSGIAGHVRQAGGTGKCLNDPGGRTANGTQVDLWSCKSNSNQRWTTVMDGTLRVHGKCLSIMHNSRSNGARLVLQNCNSRNGAQLWQADTHAQLRNPRSGKCVYDPARRARNGTHLVIEPCTNKPNERWFRPAAPIVSGVPGRCIAHSGTAVVRESCANRANRRWQPRVDRTIRIAGKCLRETGTRVNSVLSIGGCSGTAAKWNLIAKGPIAVEIRSAASGRCVTIPSKGTRLVIAACTGRPDATWRIE